MNTKLLVLLVCLLTCFGSVVHAYEGTFPASTPDYATSTLTISGANREVIVYRPSGVSSPPLLIVLSGTGSSWGYNLLDQLPDRSSVKAFSDREKVVIATPMQRTMNWGDWDNHSEGTPYWETASADGSISSDPNQNPDLLLLRAIMDEAIRAYNVDPTRIYLIGFSNGAFFSFFAATVLSDRVAAFAESGGGLVLSNTTAGTPTQCQWQQFPIVTVSDGQVYGCADLGWTSASCDYAGAIPRPIDPKGKKVPPGFLRANDDDSTVQFSHTCNLANALQGITEFRTWIVRRGGGHIAGDDYLENAWNFMKTKSLSNCGLSSKTELQDAVYGLQCIAGLRQCDCQIWLGTVIRTLRVLAGL